jgi:hypothetical protein
LYENSVNEAVFQPLKKPSRVLSHQEKRIFSPPYKMKRLPATSLFLSPDPESYIDKKVVQEIEIGDVEKKYSSQPNSPRNSLSDSQPIYQSDSELVSSNETQFDFEPVCQPVSVSDLPHHSTTQKQVKFLPSVSSSQNSSFLTPQLHRYHNSFGFSGGSGDLFVSGVSISPHLNKQRIPPSSHNTPQLRTPQKNESTSPISCASRQDNNPLPLSLYYSTCSSSPNDENNKMVILLPNFENKTSDDDGDNEVVVSRNLKNNGLYRNSSCSSFSTSPIQTENNNNKLGIRPLQRMPGIVNFIKKKKREEKKKIYIFFMCILFEFLIYFIYVVYSFFYFVYFLFINFMLFKS